MLEEQFHPLISKPIEPTSLDPPLTSLEKMLAISLQLLISERRVYTLKFSARCLIIEIWKEKKNGLLMRPSVITEQLLKLNCSWDFWLLKILGKKETYWMNKKYLIFWELKVWVRNKKFFKPGSITIIRKSVQFIQLMMGCLEIRWLWDAYWF